MSAWVKCVNDLDEQANFHLQSKAGLWHVYTLKENSKTNACEHRSNL